MIAAALARARGHAMTTIVLGAAVGVVLAAGWAFTSSLNAQTFEPTQVESIAFTAPASNVAAALANRPQHKPFSIMA